MAVALQENAKHDYNKWCAWQIDASSKFALFGLTLNCSYLHESSTQIEIVLIEDAAEQTTDFIHGWMNGFCNIATKQRH